MRLATPTDVALPLDETAAERDVRRRLLTTADWLAAIGFATAFAAGLAAWKWELRSIDPTREGNIFTWASSAAAALAGTSCVLHAIVLPSRRRLYAAVGVLLLAFSADDLVQAHEFVGWDAFRRIGVLPDSIGTRFWVAVFFPVLVVAAGLVWRMCGEVSAGLARRLRIALALLVLAVVLEGLDVPSRELAAHGLPNPGTLLPVIEEAVELCAVVLLGVTLAAALVLDVLRLGRKLAPDQVRPVSVSEARPVKLPERNVV